MDWDNYFVLNPMDPSLDFYVVVYDGNFNFETSFSSLAALQTMWVQTVLFFFFF